MDVFTFADFGKLKYVHHTIDIDSGCQWTTALSFEKWFYNYTLIITYYYFGVPVQIKTDIAPEFVSNKI